MSISDWDKPIWHNEHPNRKILITGTGRSGTSALMQVLSELGLPTGYANSRDGYFTDRGAGQETVIPMNATADQVAQLPRIIKDPRLIFTLQDLLEREVISPIHVFICHRDVMSASTSRVARSMEWLTPPGAPPVVPRGMSMSNEVAFILRWMIEQGRLPADFPTGAPRSLSPEALRKRVAFQAEFLHRGLGVLFATLNARPTMTYTVARFPHFIDDFNEFWYSFRLMFTGLTREQVESVHRRVTHPDRVHFRRSG